MALTVTKLERSFSFKKNNEMVVLSDPNPKMTVDEVMSFYANTYSELTTATVQGPEIDNDVAKFTFKTTIGTKG